MTKNELQEFVNPLDKSVYKHASNIVAKLNDWMKLTPRQQTALLDMGVAYTVYINTNNQLIGHSDEIISQRVDSLNTYYNFLASNQYDNIFTSQGKFRPTILEEFMYILLKDLINERRSEVTNSEHLKMGSARAYTNLYFSGSNFIEFIASPQIGINQKDQDFAIYRPIEISIGESNAISTNLPIVAIENKTYIDKTMLEGSIATAEKIKSGNPYALFYIVTENYDVDLKIDPIYSRINQIYVLRKSKRTKGAPLQPIAADVVQDLVHEIINHLDRNWSDITRKMTSTGKIL